MVGSEAFGNANKAIKNVNTTFVEGDDLIFYYQLDNEDSTMDDDRVFLKSDDGSYDEVKKVSKMEIIDGWAKIVFPEPDNEIELTMTYDKGDEDDVFIIFEGELSSDFIQEE